MARPPVHSSLARSTGRPSPVLTLARLLINLRAHTPTRTRLSPSIGGLCTHFVLFCFTHPKMQGTRSNFVCGSSRSRPITLHRRMAGHSLGTTPAARSASPVALHCATSANTARLRSPHPRHWGHALCARSSLPARAYIRGIRPRRSARLVSSTNTCRGDPPLAPLANSVWRVRILLGTMDIHLRQLQVHFQRTATRTALTMSDSQHTPAAKSRWCAPPCPYRAGPSTPRTRYPTVPATPIR